MSDDRRPFSPRKNARLPVEVYSEEGRRFHLTARALPGTSPFTHPERCRLVIEQLRVRRLALGCWVGAYCVMPDHLHFVGGPGTNGCSVLQFVEQVKGASTNACWTAGWTGKLWQPGCYDVLLNGENEVLAAGEYILMNPVRAGFVEDPEDWPWSGWMDALDAPPGESR
jgi:putative transposase